MDGDVDDLKEQGSVTNQRAHGNNGLAFRRIRIRFHEASLKCDEWYPRSCQCLQDSFKRWRSKASGFAQVVAFLRGRILLKNDIFGGFHVNWTLESRAGSEELPCCRFYYLSRANSWVFDKTHPFIYCQFQNIHEHISEAIFWKLHVKGAGTVLLTILLINWPKPALLCFFLPQLPL